MPESSYIPHGEVRFYQDDVLTTVLSYVQGQLHGPSTLLYPHQQPRITMTYYQGMLHGVMCVFSEQGTLVYQCPYVHNQPHGIQKTFDSATGTLICRTSFDTGVVDGESCWFYSNGGLQSQTFYKKGQIIQGPLIYDPKGCLIKQKGTS